ncbi:6-phosphogluconolactonase [Sphingobacterium spiritivorum]|uniref:6-phosphogluconolactonase n=1 Tax=Sphingobacterium spiritivorum TaxID=258 RepID=UPI003DA57CA6
MLLEKLNIDVADTAQEIGERAGKAIEAALVELQTKKDEIRVIFAAAPSQDFMLDYLAKSTKIEWSKIVAFNMDEYLELETGAPQLFSNYLENRLFRHIHPKRKYFINPDQPAAEEIARISALISVAPIDVVCLGIGQNGHIAFNDPPVADFEDSHIIKQVELDEVCRMQQVVDECFATIEDVPKYALTLTIPTIMDADQLFCVVVGEHKREAVKHTLNSPINTEWPSTILRKHKDCHFFFDRKAYPAT